MSELARRRRGLLRLNPNELGLIVAVVAVIAFTAAVDPDHDYWFSPLACARQVLVETALLGTIALGAAVVIIAGGIDLSSGSMIAFSATVCASIMLLLAPEPMQGTGEPVGWGVISVAVAGTLVAGVLVGSLHAWLITVLELPPFIATLATLVGLRSFARWIVPSVTELVTGGPKGQIEVPARNFCWLGGSYVVPPLIWITLVVFCVVLLRWTTVGRHLYALGGNEQAARLSGIRTDRIKWMAYCLSAILASIAGILYAGFSSQAKPETLGQAYELKAIAAAVVGGCSLKGGAGTILGTVLGCLFLCTVTDGIAKIIVGDADVYEGLIVGIVVVMAVAFNQLRQSGGTRIRFFGGSLGTVMVFTLALLAAVISGLIAGRTTASVAAVVALAVLGTIKFLESRPSKPV